MMYNPFSPYEREARSRKKEAEREWGQERSREALAIYSFTIDSLHDKVCTRTLLRLLQGRIRCLESMGLHRAAKRERAVLAKERQKFEATFVGTWERLVCGTPGESNGKRKDPPDYHFYC